MLSEFKAISNELQHTSCSLTVNKMDEIIQIILNAKTLFLSGEGRSGLMIAGLANRLTQIGLDTHLSSEITAPAISKNDVLIFNSASGTSTLLNSQAETAKKLGALIITFTTNENSPLAKKSDKTIIINAQSKDSYIGSIQPMGSLYEQYSLLLFDTLILRMLKKGYINAHNLREMHSNLE